MSERCATVSARRKVLESVRNHSDGRVKPGREPLKKSAQFLEINDWLYEPESNLGAHANYVEESGSSNVLLWNPIAS